MSASARAEARRKAILSRGNDRLAKLTTSARGEDAPAYMHDKQPSRSVSANLEAFVGEETNMPPPSIVSSEQSRPSPPPPSFRASNLASAPPDPSVWSEEHQNQFLQALMSGALSPPSSNQPIVPPLPYASSGAAMTPQSDPLASIMSGFPPFPLSQGQNGTGKVSTVPLPPKPATRFQKLTPLLHLLSVWCLLAFFVLWKEPELFLAQTHGAVDEIYWSRWAQLAWKNASAGGWGVQFVPFLWAFITLQVLLQSLRIFRGNDEVQPPTLLAIALPHIPPPFPSLIMNGLRYIQLAVSFFDSLAAVILGIGVVVLISSWMTD
ncbi:hypothetical protein SERLA73DRAFT_190745 [Serpula lacrymans var. lacrymans S7.3]|uniref:Uncharacterized protein n=2 Tax=Serpula lacrymans var. lacrymans TaxID=341189 RepID=F8QGA0_SERL3|nr:uncharacterized protein SERLADRAFT_478797 [Serpula lacrymans var. lacrymans S7.9]EGN92715.1 hypothetical protein SERLA73DRAFT_190745 [Serpula lacrymans var. lacrymans S7.3]EGO19421.1 hypothetical protein SERLADRAFT_478797 [Serpula lacrymans var. lacrymans S7.9]